MNVKRGLLAALVGAIAGMALTVLLIQVFQIYKGPFIVAEYVPPVIGCTSILSATAWATYAPNGKHSIAWTLVIVAVASFLLTIVLGCLFVPPQQTYDIPPERYDLSMAILMLSPWVAAAWLTRRRVRNPSSIL